MSHSTGSDAVEHEHCVWQSQQAYIEVTALPLSDRQCLDFVNDPKAGAISTFHGVTRNNFQGRNVLRLEYEAYLPMAVKMMQVQSGPNLCPSETGYAHCQPPSCLVQEIALKVLSDRGITKVILLHRVGVVAVGEPSVIIAASSPHRVDAIQAVHWAIDELKATVPIWKKEFFEDGSVWKENAESRTMSLLQPPQQ